MSKAAWNRLRKAVVSCEACPRLVSHCRQVAVEKRKAFRDESYWGKPVPNLGTPNASLLVVGLAPGAHGANRTGRMFTGDRSGDWLFGAMCRAGFANQPESTGKRDGLKLNDAAITNVGRCAPPGNKPTSEELANCRPFYEETFRLVAPHVVIALGGIAWRETLRMLKDIEWHQPSRRPKFQHAAEEVIAPKNLAGAKSVNKLVLLGCYHPSQQNTFTGRLTKPMIDQVFRRARKLIDRG